MICDFCSAPEPRWCCPAISFPIEFPHASEGDWAACDVCARLIRSNDREALAARSAESFRALHGYTFPRAAFRSLQAGFFRHRCGPLHLIDNDERKTQ